MHRAVVVRRKPQHQGLRHLRVCRFLQDALLHCVNPLGLLGEKLKRRKFCCQGQTAAFAPYSSIPVYVQRPTLPPPTFFLPSQGPTEEVGSTTTFDSDSGRADALQGSGLGLNHVSNGGDSPHGQSGNASAVFKSTTCTFSDLMAPKSLGSPATTPTIP